MHMDVQRKSVCTKLKCSFVCVEEPGIMAESFLLHTDVTITNGE
jgi:hypothetical protein